MKELSNLALHDQVLKNGGKGTLFKWWKCYDCWVKGNLYKGTWYVTCVFLLNCFSSLGFQGNTSRKGVLGPSSHSAKDRLINHTGSSDGRTKRKTRFIFISILYFTQMVGQKSQTTECAIIYLVQLLKNADTLHLPDVFTFSMSAVASSSLWL